MEIQSVIIINALTVAALGFFIRMWITGVNQQLKDMRQEYKTKVEDTLCCERRKQLNEKIVHIEEYNDKDHDELFLRLRQTEGNKR